MSLLPCDVRSCVCALRGASPLLQIMKAFSDYQRTGFGNWPWESEALAFPRERPRFAKFADGTLVERPIPDKPM